MGRKWKAWKAGTLRISNFRRPFWDDRPIPAPSLTHTATCATLRFSRRFKVIQGFSNLIKPSQIFLVRAWKIAGASVRSQSRLMSAIRRKRVRCAVPRCLARSIRRDPTPNSSRFYIRNFELPLGRVRHTTCRYAWFSADERFPKLLPDRFASAGEAALSRRFFDFYFALFRLHSCRVGHDPIHPQSAAARHLWNLQSQQLDSG